VKVRTVASGVAIAALAGVAVPVALSASASATTAPTTVPTVTKCAPATATIGKTVTIHGKALEDATAVTIGKKNKAAITAGKDKAKAIVVTVPKTLNPGKYNVTVSNAIGTSSPVQCTFAKAKTKG